jgi:hypothetical protein
MDVNIVHFEKNNWRIYPLMETDYYLNSYSNLIEAKLFVNANFYNLKKQECFIHNCSECKKK